MDSTKLTVDAVDDSSSRASRRASGCCTSACRRREAAIGGMTVLMLLAFLVVVFAFSGSVRLELECGVAQQRMAADERRQGV
jgi:hypothetical protein